jgi:hypothetical protein
MKLHLIHAYHQVPIGGHSVANIALTGALLLVVAQSLFQTFYHHIPVLEYLVSVAWYS